mgnify:CR=1 FL=1
MFVWWFWLTVINYGFMLLLIWNLLAFVLGLLVFAPGYILRGYLLRWRRLGFSWELL